MTLAFAPVPGRSRAASPRRRRDVFLSIPRSPSRAGRHRGGRVREPLLRRLVGRPRGVRRDSRGDRGRARHRARLIISVLRARGILRRARRPSGEISGVAMQEDGSPKRQTSNARGHSNAAKINGDGARKAEIGSTPASRRRANLREDVPRKILEDGPLPRRYVLFAPRAAVHPFSVRSPDASELLLMHQQTFAEIAEEEPVVAKRFRVLAERQRVCRADLRFDASLPFDTSRRRRSSFDATRRRRASFDATRRHRSSFDATRRSLPLTRRGDLFL